MNAVINFKMHEIFFLFRSWIKFGNLKVLLTFFLFLLSPASEVSKEVANLNERKKISLPLNMVSKSLSVCLSVCLSVILYSLLGNQQVAPPT